MHNTPFALLIQLIYGQWYFFFATHFAVAQHQYTAHQLHVMKHLFATTMRHDLRMMARLFTRRIQAWYP